MYMTCEESTLCQQVSTIYLIRHLRRDTVQIESPTDVRRALLLTERLSAVYQSPTPGFEAKRMNSWLASLLTLSRHKPSRSR